MRDGEGTLRLPNNNRFEGLWSRDKKNGAGCHYYLDRGQVCYLSSCSNRLASLLLQLYAQSSYNCTGLVLCQVFGCYLREYTLYNVQSCT